MAKQVKLAAIRSNEGLILELHRRLDSLVDAMDRSLMYWLTAVYRATPPEMAQDASPAATINAVMGRLTRLWNKRFSEAASILAEHFSKAARDRTDASLRSALKKTGITVDFRTTREINDIMQATIAENVSLIKSIAREHLAEVQQMAMRSVTAGRDLGGFQKDLRERFGVTHRKAALIARQSNNNTTAMISRARYAELGITQAQWVHSNAGKVPRPEHVRWNGKMYNVDTGMYSKVSKKYVWPGTDFNCRCSSRAIVKTTNVAARLNG